MSSVEKKPMRYGHSEGHTDVCYNESGQYILTCGTDGDVRIWQGIEDDDPQTISIADKVNAVAIKKGRFYTSSDTNTVQAHTFPDGSPDGIVTRFTAPVNHINVNEDATVLLAGADDFGVKLVTIEDSSQKVFIGHEAPILSVSLDPKEKYVASSSCDGTVKIWKIEDQNCEKSLSLLPKCSDISISKTLCRISWQTTSGKFLAVPVEKQIQIYERDTWDKKCVLEDSRINHNISISLWSVDGNYVIGTTLNGGIYVWEWKSKQCIQHVQHDKNLTICGIACHPTGNNELVYTDLEGQLGLINNILPQPGTVAKISEVKTNPFAGLFDDDDDGDDDGINAAYLAAADAAEQLHSTQTAAAAAAALGDDDDDDIDIDDLISQKPRHRNLQAIIDDNSMDSTSRVLSDIGNESDAEPSVASKQIKHDAPPQTPLQKSFQPTATPIHLSSRFMVWNSVGIIKAYSSDDENSIEIEFHDTSLHHAMHVDNNAGYTMASISSEAVLFAAPSQDDNTPSQLMCMHFSSWDNQKEWSTSMPKDEEITALAIGYGWVAVATDKNFIRLFSVGGFQYEVFSIAGPIVTMAGLGSQLLVSYHMATGIPGDQCLGLKLMHVTGKKRLIISGDALPISSKSTLTWLGFSAEGSPASVDSSGVVRMLNRSLLSWTPVANTKSQCKSRSDNYWVIGVHENPLQLRCILCKGSRFPATLPRPTISILQFEIPLCEMSTDKGKHEEEYWRSRYFSGHYKYNKSLGYETDETAEKDSQKKLDNTLMKLFALACKTDRDFRGAEIAELMSDEFTISLAIKYASRLKKMSLAQYLSQLAQQKSEEGLEAEDEYDGYTADAIYSQADTQSSYYKSQNGTRGDDEEEVYMDEDSNHSNKSEDITERTVILKPKKVSAPKLVAASQGRKNPFKVSANDETSASTITRGASVFDSMKKANTSTKLSQKSPKGFELKPTVTRQPRKMQSTLFQKKNKPKDPLTNGDGMDTNSEDKPVSKKPAMSAFQTWLKHNKSSLQDDDPELDEDEIMKVATQTYRKLTTEEKKEWGEKAKKETGSGTPEQSDKKRKREENNEESIESIPNKKKSFPKEFDAKTKKPLSTSTNAKLAGFAFNKD